MKLNYPRVFLYHCNGDNLNGIWEHIADGMYGGIVAYSRGIVAYSPEEGRPAAHEFYVAFSEIYDTHPHPPFAATTRSPVANENDISNNRSNNQTGTGSFDIQKFIARNPGIILTNGMVFNYISRIGAESKIVLNSDAEAFYVNAGKLTRWHIFNAGPRNNIVFNFGAGLVKEAIESDRSNNYVDDGSISGPAASSSPDRQDSQEYFYDEIVNIPPGSGTVVEVTFPEPGEYFGNDHDVGSILYGAGLL